MPPPPPPSASYSLVIHDSSSEEEDDDDDFNDNCYNRKQSIIRPKAKLVVPPVKNNTTATLSKEQVIALPSPGSHHRENQNQRLRKQLEEIGALPQTSSSSTMNVALPPSTPQDPDNEIKCGDGSEDEEDKEGQKVVISNDIIHSPPTKKKKSKRSKKNKGKKKMKKRIEEESTTNEKEMGPEEYDKLVVTKAEESVVVNVGEKISIASDGSTHHSTATDDGAMMTTVENARAIDAMSDTPKYPTFLTTETFLNNIMEERKECNDTKLLQPTKAQSTKSVSFSTVSVREYARMIGTHVVPADGGWPLGLSDVVVTEYNKSDKNIVKTTEVSSPPVIARIHPNNVRVNDNDDDIEELMSWIDDGELKSQGHNRIRARSESLASLPSSVAATSFGSAPSSPSAVTTHSRRISWTVDDFESRRQTELRQRYAQLIRDRRRRKFELEWEKKHMNVFHKKHHYTRQSINGGSRTRSSSFKVEMSSSDKEELDALVSMNITFPSELESRPYDYKKRICPSLIKSKSKGGSVVDGNDHLQDENVTHAFTEEDELYHEYGGRNPLFRTMREDERRKALHRDDHLMSTNQYCQVIDDGADENFARLDLNPTNTVVTQRVQHDLETLRSRRLDPANLGCACRKLQIFFTKRKSSHRRLPERKVQEELRKRGLLHGADMSSSSTLTRERLEILLHDAIEKEPCCWGTNCPCWRDGIGCQSDTCSCWHGSDSFSTTKVDESLLKSRCGNPNGIYFVNLDAIKQYREQYLSCVPVRKG